MRIEVIEDGAGELKGYHILRRREVMESYTNKFKHIISKKRYVIILAIRKQYV